MSAHVPPGRVPEALDAWRLVAARRGVEGRLPLSALTRLQGVLLDTQGFVDYSLDFDSDSLKVPYVELKIDTELPLLCQRTLERFLLPVQIVQRLGLIRDEADEASLPVIPVLKQISPPVVPIAPGSEAVEADWPAPQAELDSVNPFAGLSSLKKKN